MRQLATNSDPFIHQQKQARSIRNMAQDGSMVQIVLQASSGLEVVSVNST
jgi:hypothetical protein